MNKKNWSRITIWVSYFYNQIFVMSYPLFYDQTELDKSVDGVKEK